MSNIKVLIADDHAVVRQGLKHIIERDSGIDVVGEAENGNEVLEKVQVLEIDVILMDIEMPEKNGMETLAHLKTSNPNLPVIILSIFAEEQYGLRLIQSGASSYLSKTCPPSQLLEAIHKVANGGKYITSSLGELLVKNMDNEANKPIHESLSNREYQIFFMIASGKKQKDIASELSISINTVNVHRANILKKLNAKSNSEIIRYALQNDLIK
jgi:two-component system, NarL family, invasion response regulator UvrY